MIRPFEIFIGLRYIRAKRRTRFISFITATSVLGIIIGVWALISVLSVMNGFERELKSRILTVASHIRVSGTGGWLLDWQDVAQKVDKLPSVSAHAPYILSHGMLKFNNRVNPAIVRGVTPELEATVSAIGENMIAGSMDGLQDGSFGMVLGEDMALSMGNIQVGDQVILISSRGKSSPVGVLPRLKRFTVVGIFNLN
ncbi:MAG: lipoprotein-releasing system transmembrane subunit LolC, partial [Gammaproteobacteria bacterium]|nr:lipoprotein-releasing system transmembrane subunit LolC [Gammaproteobacteria bacterium]